MRMVEWLTYPIQIQSCVVAEFRGGQTCPTLTAGNCNIYRIERNDNSESLRDQHKREQARIDRELSENQKPIQPYTGEVEKALDELFEYWNN